MPSANPFALLGDDFEEPTQPVTSAAKSQSKPASSSNSKKQFDGKAGAVGMFSFRFLQSNPFTHS
jgi:hypothetical protein